MRSETQPSIASIGLKPYLDNTATIHNDHGYDEITGWFEEGQSLSEIARRIGKSRMTVKGYKMVWLMEKQSGKEAKDDI